MHTISLTSTVHLAAFTSKRMVKGGGCTIFRFTPNPTKPDPASPQSAREMWPSRLSGTPLSLVLLGV